MGWANGSSVVMAVGRDPDRRRFIRQAFSIGRRLTFNQSQPYFQSVAPFRAIQCIPALALKSIAGYGTGTEANISGTTARSAVNTATRFVDCIAGLLGA